jgi:hypothetical protein
MLAVLRQRARRSCRSADIRLSTTEADIRKFTPAEKDYDLIVSHFFLDCLTDGEVRALAERLTPHMTQNAGWLVSEFAVPEKGWKRLGARFLTRSLYVAFSVLTQLRVRQIPNYAQAFNDNRLQRTKKAVFLGGVLVAEVWERRFG